MKRRLIVALVLVLSLIFASNSFATLARIQALGNSDLYFKDIYHIYVNPAYLGMYTNYVYGELGNYYYEDGEGLQQQYYQYGQFGGINLKITNGFNLGLTLNRGENSNDYYFSWRPVSPWNSNIFYSFPSFHYTYVDYYTYTRWLQWGDFSSGPEDLIHRFDLMTSYDFDMLHLGISFYNSRDKWTDRSWYPDTASKVTYEDEGSISTTGLTFGGLINFGEENKHSAEVMGSIWFDKAKGDFTVDTLSSTTTNYESEHYKTDGGTGMSIGGRAFLALFEKVDIVPVFGFSTEKISMKYTGANSARRDTSVKSGDYKENVFFAGCGANWKLEKGMVEGGLAIAQYTVDNKINANNDTLVWQNKSTEKYFPGFNLGVEYGLTKWLDARVGVQEFFGNDRSEGKQSKQYYSSYNHRWDDEYLFNNYPENFLSFGLGFKFSKFRIDGTIYEKNFFEGTYLLSGRQTNVFGTLSATFEF